MKKVLTILFLVLFAVGAALAQRTITGTVQDQDGEALIGASILVQGTSTGTVTDINGEFSLNVPEGADVLVVSYTGYRSTEVSIGNQTTINVTLMEGITVDEVVVTALGIKREERSLGYATQEVSGEEVVKVKDVNFINSLSGKVAGVDIKRSNTLGGSSNVIIRGYTSLTGNNQALFVVDGIPIDNSTTNSGNQQTGRGGYDFGNAAMDVNPEDIESVSVLKGAAATALYGSRAANGVILITTKKGTRKRGLGVTINSGITLGEIDKSTFIKYQKEYGAGYGHFYGAGPGSYFEGVDVDGDGVEDLAVPMGEDASQGARFDPSLMVYTWESIYPELSTFGQRFPWVAAENDATTFWETAATYNNSIAIDGGSDRGTFRLSYTNFDQGGIVPNSELKRNTINFSATYDINNRLTAASTINYVHTDAQGRYGTGYDSRNFNQSFRQWYQVNVDIQRQREAYFSTGQNITWNPYGYLSETPTLPHYFDNYYWTAYENYSTDGRSRVFGNITLNYEVADWLEIMGRVTMDRYSAIQEERIAVGSVDVSKYERYNREFSEMNYDLIITANKYFGPGDRFNLNGNLGANIRKTDVEAIRASTNGGLVIPGVYSLSNSLNPLQAPTEVDETVRVDGYFARASFGYDRFLYLDLTGRYDISSTLPEGNNAYFYPSASLSFVFSELLNSGALSFGKVRLNYAEVGNSAPALSINNTYILGTPFNGIPLASAPGTEKNPDLKPELTKSYEAGIDLRFLNNRLGVDFSVYKSNTYDQIIPATVTAATGKTSTFVNAGNIENRGVELSLKATPLMVSDFSWDIGINWSRNRNEVIELFGDQTNLLLTNVQGGVTMNATVGEPYGILKGTNFVYHTNGEPIVYPWTGSRDGVRYARSSSPEVIGNVNPDWRAGINNGFTYNNVRLSFLIDIQQGGDFFSLDTWYGYATGLYDVTAGLNDKGNPVRDDVKDGGGIYIGGVVQTGTDENGVPISDGTPNTEYGWVGDYATTIGYAVAPNALHVWDASFVKLREVALTYSLPNRIIENTPFQGLDLSLIGRNLWIIHKNSPYSDPEAGLSAGNFQGYQSGVYPTVKEYGFNLRVRF